MILHLTSSPWSKQKKKTEQAHMEHKEETSMYNKGLL